MGHGTALSTYASTPTISFNSLAAAYIENPRVNVKLTTFRVKSDILRCHIIPYFADMSINQISRRVVNEWRNDLLSKGFKPIYARTIYKLLVSVFNFAVEYYNLPANPCTTIGKLPSADANVNYWTISEFRAFIAGVERPDYIMVYILLIILDWNPHRRSPSPQMEQCGL